MARLPRLVVTGQAHHLVQRGHSAQPVFVDDEDRRQYLTALRDALRAHAVLLHAYALLDDAVQLLLRPPSEGALSRMVQAVGRRYVAGFNRRHARSGTIWEGRFRAGVVQQGEPTLQALRLIDALPSRRGLAPSPQASRWSSAPHRLGLARDPWLSDPPEYWQLGNTPFEREAAYAALLAQGLDDAVVRRIEHAAANGWALGSPQFLAEMAQQSGRPVRPRARGRPPRPKPAA
jgi:putative transposase